MAKEKQKEQKGTAAKPAPQDKKVRDVKVDLGQIVRIKRMDLHGESRVFHALSKIKGIGSNMAKAIASVAGMGGNRRIKDLSEGDIKKLEEIIDDPAKHGVPVRMVNRRRDYDSGKDKHVSGSDLTMSVRDDINRLKRIRAYRGIRHEYGLPVRGQRTKSSFRKGAGMGVSRKKV